MPCWRQAFPGAALRCRTDASVALQEPQTRFVIDASVVIPWYLEHNLPPISMLFLQRLEHCQAPGVISAHVSQVLWSYCQEDLLSGTVGAAALRHFRRAMKHKITPTEELADRALEISMDLRLAPPLCLYFALAERQEADLVTAFQPFHEAVRGTPYAQMVTDLRTFL